MLVQATGPSSSPWGGRRAAAGHPSPYTLQAFAIGNTSSWHCFIPMPYKTSIKIESMCLTSPHYLGNEDCRVKGYAPNFVTIAKAIRAAYPKLPLILGCEEQDQMKDMVSRPTNDA